MGRSPNPPKRDPNSSFVQTRNKVIAVRVNAFDKGNTRVGWNVWHYRNGRYLGFVELTWGTRGDDTRILKTVFPNYLELSQLNVTNAEFDASLKQRLPAPDVAPAPKRRWRR